MPWHKYGAKKEIVDGITFMSRAEAKRYRELKLLEQSGKISELKLQTKFPCVVNGAKICTYIADFEYIEDGHKVFEDVKGMKTPMFNLKLKLVKALYPDAEILLIMLK